MFLAVLKITMICCTQFKYFEDLVLFLKHHAISFVIVDSFEGATYQHHVKQRLCGLV